MNNKTRRTRITYDDDDLSSSYSIRTMPVLPNRRTDQMRESRCHRSAQRQGVRLFKHANADAFVLMTNDGAIHLDLSLEEVEERLIGRACD